MMECPNCGDQYNGANWPYCPMCEISKLRADLAADRAEIERLNGRRCDGCVHAQIEIINTDGNGYRAFCSKHVTTFRIDHYCKAWEAK